MNKKGFIGAIGDDFPSLIPLLFAIMIFFASLGYAFTTINERNAYINTYIDSLKISKTALGKGTYNSYEDFEETISGIRTTANYIVGLTYMDSNTIDPHSDHYVENFLKTIEPESFIYKNDDGMCLNGLTDGDTPIQMGEGVCDSESDAYYYKANEAIIDDLEDGDMDEEYFQHKTMFNYIYPVSLVTPEGISHAFLVVVVW